MNRRTVLHGVGVGGLVLSSGCTDLGWGDSEDEGEPDARAPSEEHVREALTEEWERDDSETLEGGMLEDPDETRRFVRPTADEEEALAEEMMDADVGGELTVGTWDHDDGASARETYDDHPDHGRSLDETDVATESIGGMVDPAGAPAQARALFRDAHVVGWLSHVDIELIMTADIGEYESRAVELAEMTREAWRED